MAYIDQIDKTRVPKHIAIIMDGNGRWAKARGEKRTMGHIAGVETVRRITKTAKNAGVKFLTLYTFSTENWNRPAEEIEALMGLLLKNLEDEIFMKNDVSFQVIGDLKRLPEAIQKKIQEMIERTSKNSSMCLVLALSYSSKSEIQNAVRGKGRQTRCQRHQRRGDWQASVHQFHARPRVAYPHRRRDSPQQLSAVAGCILRTVLLRHLLARLQRRRLFQSHLRLSEPRTPLWKDKRAGCNRINLNYYSF